MRRVKHVLTYVLVLSICFTLFFFPVNISAEGETYFTAVEPVSAYSSGSNNWYYQGSSDHVRFCILRNGNNYQLYAVSDRSGDSYRTAQFNIESASWHSISTSRVVNGVTYYVFAQTRYGGANSLTFHVPVVLIQSNQFDSDSIAISYTYGNNAVGPEPPGPTYGKPYDVEYSTRIAGSGLASADNIDRIVWNRAVDTNGNELPTGARVQIRAIPGKYIGNTANDVLTKTYTDFVLDHSKQLIIVDIIASRGVYETKWSEVVDHFGFFPYSWVPNIQYIDNEYFKMGWIYQIRLQVDDYYSDWTNIYTATSSGASESQTITDSDEISQQLVQDINIVNQLNNTTTTNWYINETTINNSEYTENTNGKPWWAYLLEAILSLFQVGDSEQQTINNTNNLNIDLNDKLNEYNEIEDQQLNNLDTNLEAIEVESEMLENNKFVGSANWVAQQYTRITNGTVIGSLIGFSLLFGLALIFIGKIR